jgi:ferritin-like metal-binding protein YciE
MSGVLLGTRAHYTKRAIMPEKPSLEHTFPGSGHKCHMNDSSGSSSLRYDSLNDVSVATERHTLQTHVTDLIVIERHLREPVVRQSRLDASASNPVAMRVIAQVDLMTDVHIEALEEQLHQLGGDTAGALKSALSSVLEFGAGALESMRATKVSKSIRDDYAALSLAAISYTMLNVIALGFGDGSTAALAKRHLGDVNAILAEIGRGLPGIVLQELYAEGVTFTSEARHSALLNSRDAWSDSGT